MQNNSLETLKNMGRETGGNGMIIEKEGVLVVTLDKFFPTSNELSALFEEIVNTNPNTFLANKDNIYWLDKCLTPINTTYSELEERTVRVAEWLKTADDEILKQLYSSEHVGVSAQPMYTIAALLHDRFEEVENFMTKIVEEYNDPKEVWPLAVIHKLCTNETLCNKLLTLYTNKTFEYNRPHSEESDAATAVIAEILRQHGRYIPARVEYIPEDTKFGGKYTQEIIDEFINTFSVVHKAVLPIPYTHISKEDRLNVLVIEIDGKLYLKFSEYNIDQLAEHIDKLYVVKDARDNYKIVSSYFGNVRCFKNILKHGNIDKKFIISCAAYLNDDVLNEVDRMIYRELGEYMSAEDMKKMFEIEDNTPTNIYNKDALFLMCLEVFAKDDAVKDILIEIGNTHSIANNIELMFDFADYCLEHGIEFADIIDTTNSTIARVAYAHYLYSLGRFDEIFSAEDKEQLAIDMATNSQIHAIMYEDTDYNNNVIAATQKIYDSIRDAITLSTLGVKILNTVSDFDNRELIKYILNIKEYQKPFVEVIEPLKSLLGTYTCDLITPPWWEEFCALVIDDIKPDKLDRIKAALAHMAENPKLIDVGRVRENGTRLMKMLRKAVKAGVIVEKTDWWQMFNLMRGKNDSKLIYKITDSSLTKVGVSLWTSHWTSCMNVLKGEYRKGAISLMVDPEVVVIYATDGKSTVTIEGVEHDDMIARALIRPLRDENGDIQGILLDRIYADGERLKWRIEHVVRRECKRIGLKVYRNPYYFKEYSPSKVETMFCRVYAYTYGEYPYMDTINCEVEELSETVTLFSGEVYPL